MAEPDWASMVVVGRVAKPHGIKGEVIVAPETDFAAGRFASGAVVHRLLDGVAVPMRVRSASAHGDRWIVGFEGVATRNDAEGLRDVELRAAPAGAPVLAPGGYYVHELAACRVVTTGGVEVGRVERVELRTGTPLLIVAGAGGEVMVPLAHAICRRIDVAGKLIEIDPPEGLIDLNR